MNYYPLVSVIIPTYNRATDLKRAINSVIDQTYGNWEIVVVDNHSTDNTDDTIAKFNNRGIKVLKISNNGIIAASRNMGIANANGNLVAFLDSDDWWANDKLAICIAAIENGYDLVYHDMIIYKAANKIFKQIRKTNRALGIPCFNDLLVNGNPIFNSSVVARKDIIMKSGMFDENPGLVAIEDFDLWLRIAKHTDRSFKVDKQLGWYYCGSGNTTSAARTVKALDCFSEKYREDIVESKGSGMPYWFLYAKGMAQYRLRRHQESIATLKSVISIKAPFQYLFKGLIIQYCSRLRRKGQ